MNTRIVLFAPLALLFLLGCSDSNRRPSLTGLPDTGEPALHALNDSRLRELMDRMNNVMFDRFKTQPELDKERDIYARKMAATATELSSAVDTILTRMPALNLAEGEQTAFRGLAKKLRDEANTLRHQTDHRQFDAIPATLDLITLTCSSCHELFRKLNP